MKKKKEKMSSNLPSLYWYIKPICHQQEINGFFQKNMKKTEKQADKRAQLHDRKKETTVDIFWFEDKKSSDRQGRATSFYSEARLRLTISPTSSDRIPVPAIRRNCSSIRSFSRSS